jgi:transketolase
MATTSTNVTELTINTIRTLAMDAVQQANSGHPGTPMAMAPVAYDALAAVPALRPGRPDLAEPRPLRPLGGHASTLLYALLAPRRREVGQQPVRAPRRAVGDARRPQAASASSARSARATRNTTSPPASRPPPARSARASPPASAWRSPSAGSPSATTSPDFKLFDYNVYALSAATADLMEGISQRGRLAGRPPEAVEPRVDLRFQPHHHRGPHLARLQRGRRRPLPRLWLERAARRRRQRLRAPGRGLRRRPATSTTARR